jgi:hypothetical protein
MRNILGGSSGGGVVKGGDVVDMGDALTPTDPASELVKADPVKDKASMELSKIEISRAQSLLQTFLAHPDLQVQVKKRAEIKTNAPGSISSASPKIQYPISEANKKKALPKAPVKKNEATVKTSSTAR